MEKNKVFLMVMMMMMVVVVVWPQEVKLKYDDDDYEFGKKKMIGLGMVFMGSVVDGMVEGYEFDGRMSFERKWGVSRYGFWGSMSWSGKKVLGQTWDFYHVGDDLRKVGYIGGGVVIGLGMRDDNKKVTHFLMDVLVVSVVSMVGKNIGMIWVRI